MITKDEHEQMKRESEVHRKAHPPDKELEAILTDQEIEKHHKLIHKLQKELRKTSEAKQKKRDALTQVRISQAEERRVIMAERIKRLGLADIFETYANTYKWDQDGGWPKVSIGIPGSGGPNSEDVANALLARLEAIASGSLR
jgi:hypothetical protein